MPELSRFFGIVVSMFYNDHLPAHIHVYGGNRGRPEWAAQFVIHNGAILDGHAPTVAVRLVREWITIHRDELLEAWDRAQIGRPLGRIAPLRLR